MSEKRFKMGESDIQGEMIFIDTQTNKIYWQEYFDEIVDLVNEQQTTIQEQDKRIKELERMLKKCDAERIRLQNERGAIIKFGVRGGSV